MMMYTTEEFVNHLRHCIQEKNNIHLNDESVEDIAKTLLGSNQLATRGAINNMKIWRGRYFKLEQELIDLKAKYGEC